MSQRHTEMAASPEAEEANPEAVGKSFTLSILKYLKFSVVRFKFSCFLFNFSIKLGR